MILVPRRSLVHPRRRQRGFIINPYVHASSGPAAATVDAALFDGTNDYLTRTGAFTGSPSSAKNGILSFWFRASATGTKNNEAIYGIDNPATGAQSLGAQCSLNGAGFSDNFAAFVGTTSNQLQIDLLNSASPLPNGFFGATAWHHIIMAWDGAVGWSATRLYIDDVDKTPASNASNFVANLAVNYTLFDYYSVGSIWDGVYGQFGDKADAAFAELYFAPGQYLDLSASANREKFRTALGKPADLGTDGSAATGTAPMVYLHLADAETANNFATNRTGKGNFTVVGALTTSATSPSD